MDPNCVSTMTVGPRSAKALMALRSIWKRRSIARCVAYVRENLVSLDTDWYPTRAGSQFHGVTDAGIITSPLQATLEGDKVNLSGSFGVFFPGKLVAHFYNKHGSMVATLPVADVNPNELVVLRLETSPHENPTRVSLHLEDESGLDRGALQEVPIQTGDAR